MTFETLNENVMLVELTYDEMEKLHITYETLNSNSEKTQEIIRGILKKINGEKRISYSKNVVVEALPTEDGGCFFIFSFLPGERTRYRLKRNNLAVFKAECLNDFLDFISVFKESLNQKCEAYEMGNRYYLFIPKMNDKLRAIAYEFGSISFDTHYERIREYGKSLGSVYLQ